MEPSERSCSSSERSCASEGVASVISVSDASPPRLREESEITLPHDLQGPLSQLGPLLARWLQSHPHLRPNVEIVSSKHQSMAEVFPLPMLMEGLPYAEHAWMEAAVRALNWLAVGELTIADGPASGTQASLLAVLQESFLGVRKLGTYCFDSTHIESYWRSKSVNGYGEEIHSALPFKWANVEHSLPSSELAGILDGVDLSSGGIKDFLSNPVKYLKPEGNRSWMKAPRVMVASEHWDEVAQGLVNRRICDVIPLSQVLHVDSKPILGGLFGVPKGEEHEGTPVFRLIMDLRPINQIFEAVSGDLHTLPMLSQLFPLEVFPDESILISSEDIKAMFYVVGLPPCWRPLLAFGREVPESLKPDGVKEACFLTSRVLPMGFINSVAVAQSLHRSIVNRAVDVHGINREQEIRKDQPLPRTALGYRVYLDNFDVLERMNADAAQLLEGNMSPLSAELREVYDRLHVPVNERKSVKSALAGEMQGGFIEGKEGLIKPKADKVARYLRGAWFLLQSKKTDLKRIQMVAGGLVYLFSYRRCLMSCLNEVWSFIAGFEGRLGTWKIIPDSVRRELFSCIALAPLAYIDLRAPYDPVVSASDASEGGGGLSYSTGLTSFGLEASSKTVRGLGNQGWDDQQVLVISLFDGIGACRVALDVLNAKVAGYISIECNAAARRVVESAFGSTEFVSDVGDVSEKLVMSWACKYSRVACILVSAGPPCQGVSGLNANRLGSEIDLRSQLHHEVSRVRNLAQQCFSWAEVFMLMESVSSMADSDRSCMSRAVGILPYELDAAGLTPCRRTRLYWFDWAALGEDGVQIQKPLTNDPEDFGRISFLLDCPPKPYLMPGWELAGGPLQKLPTFTTSQPKADPGLSPAGVESCSERDLMYWSQDRFRFPPYQYKFQHGVTHPKKGWRLANINEREAMLGFPLDFTHDCWAKSERKRDPVGWEDCRLTLLGNSWSIPVVCFLLKNLLQPKGLCENISIKDIQIRCQPGQGLELNTFLMRPPWTGAFQRRMSENDIALVRKLGSLMSTRGTDVLLQSPTEPSSSYERLRTSVPSKLWKWATACSWVWKRSQLGEPEHINRLELRALLTAVKWRTLKAKQHRKRFLHLVDSLVSLHVVNKGRSSSRKLRVIMKKISAWLLLSANTCILGYVDTTQNPADAPSRRGQKRKWASAKL